MDKDAYIKRLEAAIFQSSEAMKILKADNTALHEVNQQLQQRVGTLEKEIQSLGDRSASTLRVNNTPKITAPQSTLPSRNKRSFGGGIKSNPIVAEDDVKKSRPAPVPIINISRPAASIAKPQFKLVKIKPEIQMVQENGYNTKREACSMTAEEQDLSNEIDKDFDDMSSSSSSFGSDSGDDNEDEVKSDEDVAHVMMNCSDSDSDDDDEQGNCGDNDTTTVYDEDNDHDVNNSMNIIEDSPLLHKDCSGKMGVHGHAAIDMSQSEHSNLQILRVLEQLKMDNVHTASLLLCKFAPMPVCEILCKYIKSVAKANAEAKCKELDMREIPAEVKEAHVPSIVEDEVVISNHSSISSFFNKIVALFASMSARIQTNGLKLCRQILFFMHDHLWVSWFPTESATKTAGWKRKGVFELQKVVFFGNENHLKTGGGSDEATGAESFCSDLVGELFASIIVHVGYKQGLFNLVESVLRSYAYVSQHVPLLGTSLGILKAMVMHAGNESGALVDLNAQVFPSSALVNNLLERWNSYSMFIISKKIVDTIKCTTEALMLKDTPNILNLANAFLQYCMSKSAFTDENSLVTYIDRGAKPVDGSESHSCGDGREISRIFYNYIEKSYLSYWNIHTNAMTTTSPMATIQSVISKWKTPTDVKPKSVKFITACDDFQPTKYQDKRFSVDIFLALELNFLGLWGKLLQIAGGPPQLKVENGVSVDMGVKHGGGDVESLFDLVGIANVDIVASHILEVHRQMSMWRAEQREWGVKCDTFREVYAQLICPIGDIPANSISAGRKTTVPTQSGVEVFTIEMLSSFWKTQLEQIRRDQESKQHAGSPGEEVTQLELEIIQRLHTIVATLKCGMIPFHFESASKFKNTNFEFLLLDNIAKCKRALLHHHIQLPAEVVDSPSVGDRFSPIEMFKAISVSPPTMRKSILMLNHCLKLLSTSASVSVSADLETSLFREAVLEDLFELAFNISHVNYEMLVFMTIATLRALMQACRNAIEHLPANTNAIWKCNRPLIRISQECIMILLNLHETSFISNNKTCLFSDISKTLQVLRQSPRERVTETSLAKIANSASFKASIVHTRLYDTVPLRISSWLWKEMFRKIPAFVINLDVREDRWKTIQNQCSEHGILPVRVAAIDARRGQVSHSYSRDDSRNLYNNEASKDIVDNIPVEVVTMTWDSTLNAKFDKKCMINTATPMTPSERACAASHVMTWKLIYEIFTKKCTPVSSELSNYLTSMSGSQPSLSLQSKSNRRQICKPLPTSRVYDAIPDIYLSLPRPQYQKKIVSAQERQAKVNSMSDLLAMRNLDGGEYYSKFFLILEDDAVIDPHPKLKGKYVNPNSKKLIKKEFLQRLKDIEDKIPADFDICYLGYNGKSLQKTIKKTLVRPEYVWQLHAYVLSPKGAAKLLMHLPVSAPVDNFIAKLIFEKKLEAYAVPPDTQLVKQEGTFSSRQQSSDIAHSSSTR